MDRQQIAGIVARLRRVLRPGMHGFVPHDPTRESWIAFPTLPCLPSDCQHMASVVTPGQTAEELNRTSYGTGETPMLSEPAKAVLRYGRDRGDLTVVQCYRRFLGLDDSEVLDVISGTFNDPDDGSADLVKVLSDLWNELSALNLRGPIVPLADLLK